MTESLWMPVFLLIALAAAFYSFWRWQAEAKAHAALKEQTAGSRMQLAQLAEAQAARDAALAAAQAAEVALAAERAGGAARQIAAQQREQAQLAMRAELEKNFQALAAGALQRNEESFLRLANETFEKHREAAAGGVKEVVKPVEEAFAKLAESVSVLDKARTADRAALGEQMRAIGESLGQTRDMTGKLVNALRAAPKTRGRWGEETLRNVLELAGLSQHCDFTEQNSVDGEGGKLRPDVTIRLPGGRCLVVDSKVALAGYLDAMEATDEAGREAHLKKHAAQIREHVRMLGGKEYQKYVPESADFVALFVPGENFFAAAAERDSGLFEYAMKQKVIIVTPATMVALAKAVAYGWRQEDAAKNAKAVADLGRVLYERLSAMGGSFADLGRSLEGTVNKYNTLIGTVESRVLVQARKLKDLGVGDGGPEPPELKSLDHAPRALTAGRDFVIDKDSDAA